MEEVVTVDIAGAARKSQPWLCRRTVLERRGVADVENCEQSDGGREEGREEVLAKGG
jgi:hypothetical protein